MKKNLLTFSFLVCAALGYADKVTYTANITRDAEKTPETPTVMRVSTNVLVDIFDRSSAEALEKGISVGTIQFLAKQGSTNSTYSTKSYGTGYWFTKSGVACTAQNANRRVACKYDNGFFKIVHNNEKVNAGDSFSFVEMFIQDSDTVQYVFNVTIGSFESVESDQPEYVETIEHRTDEIDLWPLQPLVRQNDGEWLCQHYIQVMEGDKISFSCADRDHNSVYRVRYKDKRGEQLRGYKADPEFVLTESATAEHSGYYLCSMMYKDADGQTKTQTDMRIYVDVQSAPLGTPFSWEGRVPKFSHDW